VPFQSQAQRGLMEGIAHGWHPTGMKHPPTKAVAQKFSQEDAQVKKRKLMAKALRENP